MNIVLASGSPRRAQLLDQLGIEYEVCPVEIDESVQGAENGNAYVQRLAREKARVAGTMQPADSIIIAADTAVLVDGQILGKPGNQVEGIENLRKLSGRTHIVLTGVCVSRDEYVQVENVETLVTFRPITEQELMLYWQTGEPADKAGGYAIQGLGAVFVEEIKGSYSSVVGLPLMQTAALLGAAGFNVLERNTRKTV